MPPPKKLWSDIKYWLILLIFFLVLFEMVSSMILYRKYTTGKLAILHFTESLFDNRKAHDVYAYEPYLMFRLANHSSEYVNINGFERKSDPAIAGSNSSTDTIDIFFFGGANMYGRALSDNQTIPSEFVKQYQASQPAKHVRVRNFGIPHYYSRQELMLLSKLIFEGERPDIAVFLDGATDFGSARMLYYDKPWFSYALQQTFEGKMFQKGGGKFIDSTDQFSITPAGINDNAYNAALIEKFQNNMHHTAAICSKAGIESYFFLEPVSSQNARASAIYPALKTNADSTIRLTVLDNIPQDASSFIDKDYSHQFAQKVAKQIFETLKPALQ